MKRSAWLRRSDRHLLLKLRLPVRYLDLDAKLRRRIHAFLQFGWVFYTYRRGEELVQSYQITDSGIAKLAEPPPEGRMTCINPACGRTWKDDGGEVICNACLKLLPELKAEYTALRAELRTANRSWKKREDTVLMRSLYARMARNWDRIRAAFRQEEQPDGMDAFLNEIGLQDGDE